MNSLKLYLSYEDITQGSFAKKLRISESYVSLLASAQSMPSRELAIRIEEVTNGEVPASSWIRESV